MSLPAGISTCLVTFGRATSYLGNDAMITGTLTADRTVIHAATGVRVGSGNDVVPNEAGFLSFPVPHVDQSGFIDGQGNEVKGWLYTLTGTIRYPSGKEESFRRNFQVVVGQSIVDLDLVPDGPVLPGFTAPTQYVTSVGGFSGTVTAAQLAAAVAPQDSGLQQIGLGDEASFFARRVGRYVEWFTEGDLAGINPPPGVIPASIRPPNDRRLSVPGGTLTISASGNFSSPLSQALDYSGIYPTDATFDPEFGNPT